MKIAILGPGNMGMALATQWSANGHNIIFSHSNNTDKVKKIIELVKGSVYENMPTAVSLADVVVITCQYEGLAEIFKLKDAFKDKIVLTCVSNLRPDFSGNTIGLSTHRQESVAEEIQKNLPNALVAEAFNTAFAANISTISDTKCNGSILYCTDHEGIKEKIEDLISLLKYTPLYTGGLKTARAVETFATVWVQLAAVANIYPGHTFKIKKL
jgi:8-hydroxy-5-deazaflavin:NADPH oxidoreductase